MINTLKILGIESSCDDSGAAIVDSKRNVLSNILINQKSQHEAYCGVVPEIAARAHMQNLRVAINQSLKDAGILITDLDAIAATSGPGLMGGVIVGCMIGKSLASVLDKPFIAINHLEAHALTIRLTNKIDYPYLLLLASGGHCQFVEVQNLGKYRILGQTLDDAAGEAFDKVAKMLHLGFPGGPEVEQFSLQGDSFKFDLPRPLINKPNCNFSFSGLKTAVKLLIDSLGPNLNQQNKYDICASFQRAVSDIFANKLQRAMDLFSSNSALNCTSKRFVIAGGVAANFYIRKVLEEKAIKNGFEFLSPPPDLCTDNGAMIAYAGLERLENNLTNSLEFSPRSRWSLEEL